MIPRLVHRPSISNLDMARMLRDFGFTRIVELEPWQTARVGRGRDVEVTALPYYGESVGLAPRDWMTVHVALGGRQAVCLVDAARDPYGDADQVVQEARRRFGRPDFLFAPASEFHYPLVHFNRIPFYLDRCFEVFTGGPTDVVRWATFSGARLVIPYALFHLTPRDLENDDNACDADVFRRGRVSTLAQRMRSAPDGPLCVMAPGDRLTWGGDERPLGRDIGDGVRLVQVLRA
ncbi:MAG: hypothetical protein IPO67_28485 [Deltaproteobacteria bacterium]|nr:hypothetical protein [Deltaproteobacteria bacterium]